MRNLLFYLNPIHNILPVLFPFCLWGLWKRWRRDAFLVLAILTAYIPAILWHVIGFRFALAALPLLIAFAIWGMTDLAGRIPSTILRKWMYGIIITTFLVVHLSSICIYSYGQCNAWWDRTIGGIPANLHISMEGINGWMEARQFINQSLEMNGSIVVDDSVNRSTWEETKMFRSDIALTDGTLSICPMVRITQTKEPNDVVLFQTTSQPTTYVILDGACGEAGR